MKRLFWFFKSQPKPVPQAWQISPRQHRQLLELLSEIGLGIVEESRGPVPLLTFGRRVLDRLDTSQTMNVPIVHFADALKRVIHEMQHDRLKVMSPTDFPAVGYVYNAENPDTWPVRSSM